MAEERVYTINLKEARAVARPERARKAVTLVRRYLEKHMKGEVSMDQRLNEYIWSHSIKKPPVFVKVRAIKDGKRIKAELLGTEEKRVRATAKTKKGRPGAKKVEKKEPQAETKTTGSTEMIEAKPPAEKNKEATPNVEKKTESKT